MSSEEINEIQRKIIHFESFKNRANNMLEELNNNTIVNNKRIWDEIHMYYLKKTIKKLIHELEIMIVIAERKLKPSYF